MCLTGIACLADMDGASTFKEYEKGHEDMGTASLLLQDFDQTW